MRSMRTIDMALAAVVGIVYTGAVCLAVLLLAGVQLRSSSGTAFDTWRVVYAAKKALLAEQRTRRTRIQDSLSETRYSVAFVNRCLSRFYDSAGNLQKQQIDEQTSADIEAARKTSDYKNQWTDVRCVLEGNSSLTLSGIQWEAQAKALERELADVERELAANEREIQEWAKGHQDFLAFEALASAWYQAPFIHIPYDLLVLLLVMSMGAIGGVVRLLRDYGSAARQNPKANDYVFVPLIGVVVSIGGYILAKTGLLLLSSSQGETSLSPYMISFVGIASGLLAPEVIETIASSGRKILRPKETTADGVSAKHAGPGATKEVVEAPAARGGKAKRAAA